MILEPEEVQKFLSQKKEEHDEKCHKEQEDNAVVTVEDD